VKKALFQGFAYDVVFTEHAKLQMVLRGLTELEVLEVIKTGKVKARVAKSKFWVYKKLPGRNDNLISVSIAIEKPHLIVITTMVNWRPE